MSKEYKAKSEALEKKKKGKCAKCGSMKHGTIKHEKEDNEDDNKE